MLTRQFVKMVLELVERISNSMAVALRAEYEVLFDQVIAKIHFPESKVPLAARELADVMSLLSGERQRQGRSLFELQEATGISKSALNLLENGRNANPKIETLQLIAEALGKKLVVAMVDQDCPQEQDPDERVGSAALEVVKEGT